MLQGLEEAIASLVGAGGPTTVPPDEVPASETDLEAEHDAGAVHVRGSVRLPAGAYTTQPLGTEGPLDLQVRFETVGGGTCSLYLVPEHYVAGYGAGEAFASDPEASVEGRASADYEASVEASRRPPPPGPRQQRSGRGHPRRPGGTGRGRHRPLVIEGFLRPALSRAAAR